ncbi:MAG: HEAT repeat domain-containing protein [Gemmatimonas sp.]
MKFIPSLVALVLSAATVSAQQTPPTPPAPRTPVAPVPAPLPARAPRAVIIGPDFDMSGHLIIDSERFRMDAERLAREATDRSFEATQRVQEATQRAMERANMLSFDNQTHALESTSRAQEAVERAMSRLDWGSAYAPLANLSGELATTLTGSLNNALANSNYAYAYSPSSNLSYSLSSSMAYAPDQSRWDWKQDPDPADSLYRVANEAMNRGDYRRSADLFAQVQVKYPKSTRLTRAAYNESLMRYRLGTTDELKTALRVITDKTKISATSGDFANEVGNLTMRVRGALAQRGDAEQQRIVAQEAQKGGCDREEMQVQAEALSAMASADMNAAVPMLRRVLARKDPCMLDLRRSALRILLRRQDTAATNAAIAVAKNNDETLELRMEAVSQLARLPGDNALATLEELMRTSNEREIQRAAVRALSNTDNARARTSVRTIIERNDVSEELRIEAVNSFQKERNSPEDATYLRSLYGRVQSERVKNAVLSAISRMGGMENDQFLMGIARNAGESSDVRSYAIGRLSRSNTSIAVSDIGKLYDAAESRSLRSQVVNVLGQRKEPEALDKLIEILKTSTDYTIRSQVVQFLARNPDPKAKKALEDVAGKGGN